MTGSRVDTYHDARPRGNHSITRVGGYRLIKMACSNKHGLSSTCYRRLSADGIESTLT